MEGWKDYLRKIEDGNAEFISIKELKANNRP